MEGKQRQLNAESGCWKAAEWSTNWPLNLFFVHKLILLNRPR